MESKGIKKKKKYVYICSKCEFESIFPDKFKLHYIQKHMKNKKQSVVELSDENSSTSSPKFPSPCDEFDKALSRNINQLNSNSEDNSTKSHQSLSPKKSNASKKPTFPLFICSYCSFESYCNEYLKEHILSKHCF